MNKLQLIYIAAIFFLNLCLSSCQKEEINSKHTGITIYPTETSAFPLDEMMILSLRDHKITFGYWNHDSSKLKSIISFDVIQKKLTGYNVFDSDTCHIYGSKETGINEFVGVASDYTKPSVVLPPYSFSFFSTKLVLFDNKLNILKQNVLRDTLIRLIKFISVGDLFFIFYSIPDGTDYMLCYDKNLDIKWTKSITNINPNEIFFTNQFMYIFEIEFDRYLLKQHDLNGNLIKSVFKLFPSSLFYPKMVRTEDDLIIFSLYNTPNERMKFSIKRYDLEMNLIETKLLSTKSFSYTDAIIFKINSNIIRSANNYYFTIAVDEFTYVNFTTTKTKLVKINSKLEIEWVKTIDEYRKYEDRGHLVLDDNTIINIGKGLWNGMEGISVVSTDLDGNILE